MTKMTTCLCVHVTFMHLKQAAGQGKCQHRRRHLAKPWCYSPCQILTIKKKKKERRKNKVKAHSQHVLP